MAPAAIRCGTVASSALRALPRGFALFLGAFAVANVVRSPDANLWWIDLRALPHVVASAGLFAAGVILRAWAVFPAAGTARRLATAVAAAGLAVAAAANGVNALALRAAGAISADAVPLSFVIAAALGVIAWSLVRRRPSAQPVGRGAVVFGALAVAALFPVAQQVAFGRSDYRRHADAIVVFGARTYADGRASVALADRVRTACDVWHERAASCDHPMLFLSGGPGDGAVRETDAMCAIAAAAGVPAASIVVDRAGVSSLATVRNAAAWARANGATKLLAVSHAYHLPRVRLEFDREGLAAFTVPARESRILPMLPWYSVREVAAWWTTWAVRPARAS